jgi:hypothetical protein
MAGHLDTGEVMAVEAGRGTLITGKEAVVAVRRPAWAALGPRPDGRLNHGL